MSIGTLNGLILKYFLDNYFIFNYKSESRTEDAGKFMLYSLMGVITTLLFWITEVMFDYYFDHPNSKYIGAVLGLSLGYFIKYQLYKRFVFQEKLVLFENTP